MAKRQPRVHVAEPNSALRAMRKDPRHNSIAIFVSPGLTSKYDQDYVRAILDAAVAGPKGFDPESNGLIIMPWFQDSDTDYVKDWCRVNTLPVKILSSTGKYARGTPIPINDKDIPGLALWDARRAIFFWAGEIGPVAEGLEAAWRMQSVTKMKVYIKDDLGRFERINLKDK